jgi:hypothetical protein
MPPLKAPEYKEADSMYWLRRGEHAVRPRRWLRHLTGYAVAARGKDTQRLRHFLGHPSITNAMSYSAMSPEPFKNIWRS